MKMRKETLIILGVAIATASIILLAGSSKAVGRFSLGIMFTTLIWFRAEHHTARWLALAILWLGILVSVFWSMLAR